jgi:cytochrome d ubiquinol oxidase subunit II
MILVVVLLFVAFPPAFAAIMTALHVPVALMLVGITLRGAAFVFRAYGPQSPTWSRWGGVFAASSAVTPVLLGVILGAVASGRIRLGPGKVVETDFVSEWLAPFPWVLGLLVLALFAYLAAVYLAVEADDDGLRDDFRTRAIVANAAFGVCAAIAALASREGAPHLAEVLFGTARAWAMQGLTALVATGAMAALVARRFRAARALAIAQVVLVVAAWVVAQDGQLLVGALSVREAAAPPSILAPVLVALGVGSLALVPAFVALYRVFKGQRAQPAHGGSTHSSPGAHFATKPGSTSKAPPA